MQLRTTTKRSLAQENPRSFPDLLAERSGGGFAGSPDVPASAPGPRIVYSLHAGCRVECETSGLDVTFRDTAPSLANIAPSGDRCRKPACRRFLTWNREQARFLQFV